MEVNPFRIERNRGIVAHNLPRLEALFACHADTFEALDALESGLEAGLATAAAV